MNSLMPTAILVDDINSYLAKIRAFPNLEAEEEYELATRYQKHNDVEAAHKLVTSHLKLVPKIASRFSGYGLSNLEMIAEGNIGLMQAVKKFNPELGYRLSTYAMWWIKASIQEFIIKSWSLVKIGTTTAQKKLFFNLRKLRNQIQRADSKSLSHDDVKFIATKLNVDEKEVVEMETRMLGNDISLNQEIFNHNDNSSIEMIDSIAETRPNQELMYASYEEHNYKRQLMYQALKTLNEREQKIITTRRLQEKPKTLKELSQDLGVSQERVRQIEERALAKLKQSALEFVS